MEADHSSELSWQALFPYSQKFKSCCIKDPPIRDNPMNYQIRDGMEGKLWTVRDKLTFGFHPLTQNSQVHYQNVMLIKQILTDS
ncbi:hypothetical protein TNCV_745761 [Trichonephila clavipes]|nr:hypothetical protein TNCV_745761 [Trichonephila clavipes]